jgi:uncharacterized membrane protein YqjE
MATADSHHPGVLHSVRRVVETMADMARSRLELASIELGETFERLITSLIIAFMAVLLLGAALVALSAVAEEHRALVLAAMVAIYLLIGLGMLAWLRNYLRSWPALLSATLAELQQDSRVLRGNSIPTPAAPSAAPSAAQARPGNAGPMNNGRTGGG